MKHKRLVKAVAEVIVQGTGHKRRKPLLILDIMLVIIIAGGAGFGFRWWNDHRNQKEAAKPTAITKKINNVQDLGVSGNYAEAHDEIKKALNNPQLGSDEKYDLLVQQGLTYENEQKYDDAINSYRQAEALKQTQAVAEAVARTAEAKGDNNLAISYYKKAISRISKDNPVGDSQKQSYETAIKRLGGSV